MKSEPRRMIELMKRTNDRPRCALRIAKLTSSLACLAALVAPPVSSSDETGTATHEVAQQPPSGKSNAAATPKTIVNSIGTKLVLIPAGEFMMGSRDSDADSRADERPRHLVRITQPFYIGMYEITQGEYERVLPGRKSFFRWPDGYGKDRVEGMVTSVFPAELVKWVDAVEFCRSLSDLPEEKKAGRAYRLPTESEWEYACRAGTETAFHYGNSLGSTQANFIGTAPFGGAAQGPFRNRTTAVGSFEPNAFGLYDMHGNVWEWSSDWYGRYYYQNSPADDPQGPASGTRKIIRGGDWYSDGRDLRTAFRYAGLPRGTFYATGVRVVMTPGEVSSDSKSTSASVEATPSEVYAQLATVPEPAVEAGGEDWPRWRGPRGDGTWNGAKLPARWPAEGLRRIWRQPVGGGYGGVTVAHGRVYVMDRQAEPKEVERQLCFDAATGELLWEQSYPVDYAAVDYGNGPRTTPAVFDQRVYMLGATGQLHCLDAGTGTSIWSSDLVRDHGASVPPWGFCASPFVFEDLLMVHAGSARDGCLIAFDRATGATVWSSLADPAGYATPIVVDSGGKQQLVAWTPTHVRGVDARSGQLLWSVPIEVEGGMGSIAMPIFAEGLVLITSYYDGTMAIRLGDDPAAASVSWRERRNLRGHMAQPLYRDGHGYVLDKRHGLTGFEMATGKKLWDAENRVTAKARNPHATMVWIGDGDRALILNSDGDLILARLNPSGYSELSRSNIIGETWAHPAYAGTRVYARSDSELVCVSLTEAKRGEIEE